LECDFSILGRFPSIRDRVGQRHDKKTLEVTQNVYVLLDLGADRLESPCIHALSLAAICTNLQSMRQCDGTTQQATLIPGKTLITGV